MAKAILEFDLPEDESDFNCARNGSMYLRILQDVYNAFRSKAKHASPLTNWGDAYDLLNETFRDNNFDPWEDE
jgi:hypothetical protein